MLSFNGFLIDLFHESVMDCMHLVFLKMNGFLHFAKVHRACAEREILDMLDHPFLPALYASFQVNHV